MHGSALKWCVCMTVAGLLASGSTSVWGQQDPLANPDPGYVASSGHPFVFGSAHSRGEADDLDARVADLEAALQKMKDKEAAAKKKAAGKPSIKVGGRIQLDYALFGQGASRHAPNRSAA